MSKRLLSNIMLFLTMNHHPMSLALTSTAWFLITVGYFVVVSQLNLAHAWPESRLCDTRICKGKQADNLGFCLNKTPK